MEVNVTATFDKARMTMNDIDAIAVTTRPGLTLSLLVGLRYAKFMARKFEKPIIPIHHMQAHALTIRMEKNVNYPFLCLLASGGHCLLAFVKSATKFVLLGESVDMAPGLCFDKVARELQLKNLPHLAHMHGGAAIEMAAKNAKNPNRFKFCEPMMKFRNCQFSFSGLQVAAIQFVETARLTSHQRPDQTIPEYEDLCASLLHSLTKHIVRKTQRAMEIIDSEGMWKDSEQKRLVFSGGVACNNFIYTALAQLCEQMTYTIYRPSKNLCTDNGVMIAWNGVERWLVEREKYLSLNIDELRVVDREPIGENMIETINRLSIKCRWKKLPIFSDSLQK